MRLIEKPLTGPSILAFTALPRLNHVSAAFCFSFQRRQGWLLEASQIWSCNCNSLKFVLMHERALWGAGKCWDVRLYEEAGHVRKQDKWYGGSQQVLCDILQRFWYPTSHLEMFWNLSSCFLSLMKACEEKEEYQLSKTTCTASNNGIPGYTIHKEQYPTESPSTTESPTNVQKTSDIQAKDVALGCGKLLFYFRLLHYTCKLSLLSLPDGQKLAPSSHTLYIWFWRSSYRSDFTLRTLGCRFQTASLFWVL